MEDGRWKINDGRWKNGHDGVHMHMHMRRRMYQTQCPDQLSGKHQSYDKKSVDGRTLQSSKIEAIHCHRRNTYCFTTMCVSHSISVDERLYTYVLEGKANELLAMPKRSQIWIRDIDSDTVCHVMSCHVTSCHVMEWNGMEWGRAFTSLVRSKNLEPLSHSRYWGTLNPRVISTNSTSSTSSTTHGGTPTRKGIIFDLYQDFMVSCKRSKLNVTPRIVFGFWIVEG